MPAKFAELAVERLEQTIHLIRGHKVLLDRDLAALYGVETKILNRAVRRNIDRFPADFSLASPAKRLNVQGSNLAP